MRNILAGILVVLGFGAAWAEAHPAVGGVCWPLDLETRYLTSNFMEYRGGRYHAGLDFKTQSREGFVVRAVEDGYISRLRCTPTAYGRVVYLRGDSGRTFVFAHMQRFNDDLRQRVELNQQASGKYRTSLYFQEDEIRVRKGDVLGLSGQSGTGGPHLHFEVRDRNQRPVDPQVAGFAVRDALPPVIHSLRAWPASADARIFGEDGEWVYPAAEAGGLAGDLGVLVVRGPVAFSARVVEATDAAGHRLEPWLIELRRDGEVVYRCANEAFAFDQNAQQRLEWTDAADWTEGGIPREHWLHRREGVTLPGREGDLWYLGDEGLGLEPGLHHLELRAVDRAGNSAAVRWQVLVTAQAPPEGGAGWLRSPLGVRFPEHGDLALTPFFSRGNPARAGLESRVFRPGVDDVLEPLELWYGVSQSPVLSDEFARNQGLEPVAPAVLYLTADWPVGSSLPVAWPDSVAGDAERGEYGVYRLKKKRGEWDFVEAIIPGAEVVFHLEDPGAHAIFRDVAGPLLGSAKEALVVRPGLRGTVPEITLPRWARTPIECWDPGSGLDTGSLECLLDGKLLIVEPDPPRDRILVHWPDGLKVGEHPLEIAASDRVGHTTRRTYRVLVTEEKE